MTLVQVGLGNALVSCGSNRNVIFGVDLLHFETYALESEGRSEIKRAAL